ncbi:MAG: DNA polymerase, partial [Bacteroidota bacterium]
NLQNIPVRSGIGREIRTAFVPAEGYTLLAADYVQIELRILAHMSGDPGLVEAFSNNEDIHTAAAARIFGISPEEVTRDQRRKAKEVNYGIPYGISVYELSQRLRVTYDEAKELMDQYHQSYPKINQFMNALLEKAREQGYVETLLGRRRYVPQIRSRNGRERAAAERVAVNMPIQGTQADMIKIAMVALDEKLRDAGLDARMILQVHDELVFEVAPGDLDAVKTLLETEMVKALPLDVPILVDAASGANWLDAH